MPELTIHVNGEERHCPAGLDLESVLVSLGFQPRLVVVEYNGDLLPRELWRHRRVEESDVLEVVTIVGGGS